MPISKNIAKYLANYAEPESSASKDIRSHWQQVLVVPAYREDPDCIDRLTGCEQNQSCLLIVVLNQPSNDPETEWAVRFVNQLPTAKARSANLSLHDYSPNWDVLLVDRIANPLPDTMGVGLARKIGADIALSLINEHCIENHVIHHTDADAILPANYFLPTDGGAEGGTAAWVYPFQHIGMDIGTALYEWHLQHYVQGLKKAGSDYAWHTLGSTLAISAEHYAQVRGFPKRSAGEDFYILNKLAKTGRVANLDAPKILLQSRHSSRVPFGTGPAARKIAEDPFASTTYDPICFDYLKYLLDHRKRSKPWHLPKHLDEETLDSALHTIGFDKAMARIQTSSPNAAIRDQHWHVWFDAFRSLKFIHAITKAGHPRLLMSAIDPSRFDQIMAEKRADSDNT